MQNKTNDQAWDEDQKARRLWTARGVEFGVLGRFVLLDRRVPAVLLVVLVEHAAVLGDQLLAHAVRMDIEKLQRFWVAVQLDQLQLTFKRFVVGAGWWDKNGNYENRRMKMMKSKWRLRQDKFPIGTHKSWQPSDLQYTHQQNVLSSLFCSSLLLFGLAGWLWMFCRSLIQWLHSTVGEGR